MKRFLFAAAFACLGAFTSHAQTLDVEFDKHGNCGQTRVWGLNPNGDGYLAVRSGPGTQYGKIDELHNGDWVFIFAESMPWMGVVYGVPSSAHCNVPPNARRGWVHSKWLDIG